MHRPLKKRGRMPRRDAQRSSHIWHLDMVTNVAPVDRVELPAGDVLRLLANTLRHAPRIHQNPPVFLVDRLDLSARVAALGRGHSAHAGAGAAGEEQRGGGPVGRESV